MNTKDYVLLSNHAETDEDGNAVLEALLNDDRIFGKGSILDGSLSNVLVHKDNIEQVVKDYNGVFTFDNETVDQELKFWKEDIKKEDNYCLLNDYVEKLEEPINEELLSQAVKSVENYIQKPNVSMYEIADLLVDNKIASIIWYEYNRMQ